MVLLSTPVSPPLSLNKGPTLPPRQRPVPTALRQWVLGRDGYQCRAPGCSCGEGLAVCHVDPQRTRDRNHPDNLVTVCSVCRPLWDFMGRGPFVEEKTGGRILQDSPSAVNQ